MDKWNILPSDDILEKTKRALVENGMETHIVASGKEAKKKLFSLLPKDAQVLTMTSVTLDTLGISKQINKSGTYDSVRNTLNSLDREKDSRKMQILGASPEWTIGSVHAVTQDGHVLIASNTGSQLAAYVYGADHIIWMIGVQKVVKDTNEAIQRIYEHTLPLESERAHKAYGVPGSSVSKLLILNKEVKPGRITVILVKEVLGF